MALLKDFKINIKAGPDDGLAEGEFTAYASVFGNKDSYGDVVMPGAFADTLTEWKDSGNVLPLLFGHNMSDPDYNIGSVVEAKEDDRGLLTRNLLDLENPKAAQVYRLLKGRRLSQMSFAYDVLEGGEAQREKSAGDGTETVYELRKLKLYEVSVVPIGANQETEILAVKAAQSALRLDAGSLTEESKSEILKAIKALGDLLNGGQETKTSLTDPSKPGGGGNAATGSKASPAARIKLLAAMQTQLALNGVDQ